MHTVNDTRTMGWLGSARHLGIETIGKDILMKKKRRSREEVVRMLQEAEAKIAGGRSVEDASQELGVSVPTFYLWRRKYGGGQGQADQGKRVRELEQENAQLKQFVGEQALEILRLKQTIEEM